MAAALRIPLIDRGKATLLDQALEIREADPLEFDRWAAFRHGVSLVAAAAPKQSALARAVRLRQFVAQ